MKWWFWIPFVLFVLIIPLVGYWVNHVRHDRQKLKKRLTP